MRILLVEDDTTYARSIELMLKSEGLVCDRADYGEEGLEFAKIYEYDLVVLDLMLPDMEGFDVLRRLRDARIQTPVLILSGLDTPDKKIKGLELGADDYLTKPFDRRELIARIRAVVRRSNGHAQSVIRTGSIEVNLDARTVHVDEKKVRITGKQFDILALLSLRKGIPQTKEAFLNHLYGGMDEPEQKIIDVFVCKLRRKLAALTGGDSYIETVWGCGYVLRDPDRDTCPEDWESSDQAAA